MDKVDVLHQNLHIFDAERLSQDAADPFLKDPPVGLHVLAPLFEVPEVKIDPLPNQNRIPSEPCAGQSIPFHPDIHPCGHLVTTRRHGDEKRAHGLIVLGSDVHISLVGVSEWVEVDRKQGINQFQRES